MNNISPLLALSGLSIALIVIVVILLIAVIALYFIGRKAEKKQAEHDALEQSYLSLKKTVNQLTQVNDNNRLLLKESMDMIDFEINLAKNASMAPQTANYGKGAYEETGGMGSTSFDARQ